MKFQYKGVIPASKSIMNRALICASYDTQLTLGGTSSCDDVRMMEKALHQLMLTKNLSAIPMMDKNKDRDENKNRTDTEYDCGAAGTVLRFLTLRLSRIPGQHKLKGTKRLMQRPQQDLLEVLTRLGVRYSNTEEHLTLFSDGWKNLEEPIAVHRGVSSQFASSLILNSWNLDSDLILESHGNPISEGYFEMTLNVVKNLGMNIVEESKKSSGTIYRVLKKSSIRQTFYQVESDLSSAFAIAAYAALNGEAIFEKFPHPSLQPDSEFVDFMKQMGISLDLTQSSHSNSSTDYQLHIHQTPHFKGIECNLKSCPDLFPVLAVLCAFAQTPSRLFGAPQLIHKESNRIEKTSELLRKINIQHESTSEGMLIHPSPIQVNKLSPFTYDTDHDHRLAFAAALVQSQKIPITIQHPEVVSKSFPEFWDIIQTLKS